MTKQNFGFTIVKNFDEEKFKIDIQQLLNDGWQLHGDMKVIQYESGRQLYMYIQALTTITRDLEKDNSI